MKPKDLSIGSVVGPVTVGPIKRLDLALYCGASGDHNPMHVDLDFARESGQQDVFAHGMLSMAFFGRLLTDNFGVENVRSFSARFMAITHVGDVITCSGRVAKISQDDNGRVMQVDLRAETSDGVETLNGAASIAIQEEE